jgi:subtilisin family serine protease/fibronectin type 3 domain-containing protein
MHSLFRIPRAWTAAPLLGAALLLCAALVAGAAPGPATVSARFRTDRVLVAFHGAATFSSRLNTVSRLGLTPDPTSNSVHFARLNLPTVGAFAAASPEARVKAYIAELRKDPTVRVACPDYLVRASATPNDPQFPQLWGLHNTGQTGGTADADIDAAEAWDKTTGSDSVVVAVIDTGVDYNHPDLKDNIYKDANGNVIGHDFVNNDTDPMDDDGHGTHCSGTIGGRGNNAVGVVGVCHRVKIMPIKFLDENGDGSYGDAIEAIDWAREHGAKIMSNSWSGGGDVPLLKEAVQRASDAGILFLAAAGNEARNTDSNSAIPANYSVDIPAVISVAATDHTDTIADFSNYGATTVNLAAPGVDIVSTLPNNTYGAYSGTSMATPHVAGAAALLMAAKPTLTMLQLKARLLDNVDKIAGLAGKMTTGGRLNINRAITYAEDTTAPGAPTAFAVTHRSRTAILVGWKGSGDDGATGTALKLELRYSTAAITAANFSAATLAPKIPAPAASGVAQKALVTGLTPNRSYYLAIRATDDANNNSSLATVGPISTPTSVSTVVGFTDDVEGAAKFTGESPWAVSTEESASPTHAYSDSPGTTYGSSLDLKLTQNAGVLITGFVPSIRFQLKTDLEDGYDSLGVEISKDDGDTWAEVKTFTGVTDWRLQDVPVNEYWGESVRVRFRLNTDKDTSQQGVWVDDIQLAGDRLVPIGEATAPPTAPDTLVATASSSNKIDLTWRDRSDTETGFKLERKVGTGEYGSPIALAANRVSYSDTTVAQNTKYTYRIRATNAAGDSANSAEATATTPQAPPAAPTGLTAKALGSREVQLDWTDRSDSETGFRIERQLGTGGFAGIATVGAGVVTYRDKAVVAGNQYGYRIEAFHTTGFSPYSNTARVTTPTGVPNPPTNVTAVLTSSTAIKLTWKDNSTDETGFEVWRKVGSGAEALFKTVAANTVLLNDTPLATNTKYAYRVRAAGTGGPSAYAGPAEATTPMPLPAAPSGLTAVLDSATSITLTWTDASNNESNFRIERRTTGAFAEITSVGANIKTYRNTALAPNTTYSYRVRASNTGGNSPYSNTAGATTPRTLGGKLSAPTAVDFGKVKRKKTKTLTITLRNVHATELLKVSVIAPAAPFKVVSGGTEVTLQPGAQQLVQVSFRPTKKKSYKATLTIRSSEVGKPTWPIHLTGKGK